jgi:hypothetical protein
MIGKRKAPSALQSTAIALAPSLRTNVRNFSVDASGAVWAGYRIGNERWAFRTPDAREIIGTNSADVWSQLAPRQVRTRICVHPFPIQSWAAALDRRTPTPMPDVHLCDGSMSEMDQSFGRCGCETWNMHLRRQQDAISASGGNSRVMFRYLSVGTVSTRFDFRAALLTHLDGGETHKALRPILDEEKRVFDIVKGWRGSLRMNEREQAWLRRRSLAPGVQPGLMRDSDGWDASEIDMLSEGIAWHETPFGRTVEVTTWPEGVKRVTAVRVLSLARIGDMNYPENGLDPWLDYANRAVDPHGRAFPVEFSIVGALKQGQELSSETERNLRRAIHLRKDFEEYDEIPPAAIESGIQVANETRDLVMTGRPIDSTFFDGQVNAIVTGEDVYENGRFIRTAAEVVEERASSLTRLYGGNVMKIDLSGHESQAYMLRSTVQCEPIETIAYQRRFRLPMLAFGMGNIHNGVGDGVGPFMGRSMDGAPFLHDPHYSTEGLATGRAQAMHLIAATLGGGKSVLMALIAYNAARRGIRVVMADPSGPMAELATLPELAPFTQVIDLRRGRPGILSPPSLIRDPERSEFPTQSDFENAIVQARASRRDLTVDMARRCLQADLYEKDEVREVFREAARTVAENRDGGWDMSATLWDLYDALLGIGSSLARAVAGALEDASSAPLLSLLFPARWGDIAEDFSRYDKTLTIITTPGIVRAPDGVGRQDWNPDEFAADVVLRLVTFFTDRLVFSKPRKERCIAMFDEAESLTDSGTGRSYLARLGRDHSKWNIAVYLGVKSVNDTMLSGELKNFLASVYVGRMAGRQPALDVLKLLGIDDEQYALTLMNLSRDVAGQFVHLDIAGDVGLVQIQVPERLKPVVFTDPGTGELTDWTRRTEEEMA